MHLRRQCLSELRFGEKSLDTVPCFALLPPLSQGAHTKFRTTGPFRLWWVQRLYLQLLCQVMCALVHLHQELEVLLLRLG